MLRSLISVRFRKKKSVDKIKQIYFVIKKALVRIKIIRYMVAIVEISAMNQKSEISNVGF